MAICDNCGNDYARSFSVTLKEETYTFDCFECAVHKLAPHCQTCSTPVIGHGIEGPDGAIFCCSHCAERAGIEQAVDHVRR